MKKTNNIKAAAAVMLSFAVGTSAAMSAYARTPAKEPTLSAVVVRREINPSGASAPGASSASSKGSVQISRTGGRDTFPEYYKSSATPIKRQGSSETCWAFAGLGALEAYLVHEGRGEYDFSEQHLSWWSTETYNADNTGWLFPNLNYGGYSMTAAGYCTAWCGPKAESDIPYLTSGNTVLPENIDETRTLFGTTGIAYIPKNEYDIKKAIMKYGAVATSYNNGFGYNSDRTAYYNGEKQKQFKGHAVTIIGWDDNYSTDNFNESSCPPDNGAWIAKNTWGNTAAEGYLYISYYDRYVFDTPTWGANIAFTAVRTMNDYDRIYQHDKGGATFYTYLRGDDGPLTKAGFINVFDFDEEHRYLQEVIFETRLENASYSVYYIPMDGEKPSADSAQWTLLAEGVTEYGGYINVDVSGKTEVSGKAGIGVVIESNDEGELAKIGVDEWLSDAADKYIYLPERHRGDCFVWDGSHCYDLIDVYDANSDEIGGSLVIKAIASSDVIGDANDDAVVSTDDALAALRAAVGLSELDALHTTNCDVNRDGIITSEDAMMILRRSAQIIPEF